MVIQTHRKETVSIYNNLVSSSHFHYQLSVKTNAYCFVVSIIQTTCIYDMHVSASLSKYRATLFPIHKINRIFTLFFLNYHAFLPKFLNSCTIFDMQILLKLLHCTCVVVRTLQKDVKGPPNTTSYNQKG